MNGITVKTAVEHLSGILSWYLSSDLDSVSRDAIASTLRALQTFEDKYGHDRNLDIILGPVSDISSHLYVARGYATTDIPRPLEYYQNMNAAKRYIRQLLRR